MPELSKTVEDEYRDACKKLPYLHDPLVFSLYAEAVPHWTDLSPLWKAISSLGFSQLNVDTWLWNAEKPVNAEDIAIANFVSDSCVPLADLCQFFVLRILVPDSFNLLQEEYLDRELLNLRAAGLQENHEAFSNQLRQCALFTYYSRRPPVMLPYSPGKIFDYAAKILSFLPPCRTDNGQELLEVVRTNAEFLIHIPLDGNSGKASESPEEDGNSGFAALKWWYQLKIAVDFAPNVGVALEIPADLPAEPAHLIDMWRSEPIKTIILPTNIFLTSTTGTPHLTPPHKIVIQSLFQLKNVTVTLRPGGILTGEAVPDLAPYLEYLRGVYHDALTGFPEVPYATLFPPDQPLHKNLTTADYEDFELDVQKYTDYEAAIRKYIISRQSHVPEIFTVAVVGCGRGPLVTAALNAARDLNATVRVYALEKNPLTVAFLEENLRTIWAGDDVRLVVEDMRTWQPECKFDLLLSELLGGFGDNELSPECLAGPERFLTEKGVSIPEKYTSYLCPISSTKIYELFPSLEEELREHVYGFDVDCYQALDQPQAVFTFSHPSVEKGQKDRYRKLTFTAHVPGLLHGFAGFFVAKLYGDIEHNLLPGSQSPGGLRTWSKVFFPLITPYLLAKDEVVCLHFWRRSVGSAVWYEWTLSAPRVMPIHNAGGHACRMPLDFEMNV